MKTLGVARPIAVAVGLACLSLHALAQQPAVTTGVPVKMIVSVEAKHGEEIPPINQHDIVVREGKSLRSVTAWVPTRGNSLELAVLIDDSAGTTLGTQLNELRHFIQELAPATLVAVGYMRNGTVYPTQNFTLDHAAAAKTVRLSLGYGEQSSPYLSLSDFIKHWPRNPTVERREVLMITSGIDVVYVGPFPNPYVEAAIRDSQCADIPVYSIYTPSAGHLGHSYWLSTWGQNYLAELSEETGGEAYYYLGPQAPVSFAPYLNQLIHQLSNQFQLTFLAEPQKKAGTEPVRITSEIHSVDFVHANQVCVPASAVP
jgi:hypothetical protein